jgi:hypothetical protein
LLRSKKAPTASAGTDIQVCGQDSANATVSLGATAALTGQTGTWTIINGTGGTVSNPNSATSTFTSTALDLTTYTLVWTVTSAPCTPATDTVVVTVYPMITGNYLLFISMCRDASGNPLPIVGQNPAYTLRGGTGTYTYGWARKCNGSGGKFDTLVGETNAFIVVPQLSVNCFYRRTVKSGPCSSNTSPGSGADGHINVNNLPTKFDSITPYPTAAFCKGDPNGIKVGVTNTIQGDPSYYTVTYELYRDGVSTGLTVSGNNGTAYFSPNQTISGDLYCDRNDWLGFWSFKRFAALQMRRGVL